MRNFFNVERGILNNPFPLQKGSTSHFSSSVGFIVGLIFLLLAAAILWAYFVVCAYLDTFGAIPGFIPSMQAITDLADLAETGALWGQFGDFVGGLLNPLMTFLSFLALCITIVLQNVQLRHSANELELSRKALEQGQAIQAATEAALKDQIGLARQEKDFASLERLAEFYRTKMNEWSAQRDSEKYNALDRKRETIFHLLDSEFDVIAGRVMDGSLNLSLTRGDHGSRFTYELLYVVEHNVARVVVLDKEALVKYSLQFPEIKEYKEGNPLVARYYALTHAKEVMPALLDKFSTTGSWGPFDVVTIGV